MKISAREQYMVDAAVLGEEGRSLFTPGKPPGNQMWKLFQRCLDASILSYAPNRFMGPEVSLLASADASTILPASPAAPA